MSGVRDVRGLYDDIIDLPHHVSATRSRLPISSRAAQFAPFAALTGYDAAIGETARLTHARIQLGDDARADLDMKMGILTDMIDSHPEVAVVYFRPDGRKEGGMYVTATGKVKRIDDHQGVIALTNGEVIVIEDVLDIQSALFGSLSSGE